MSNLAPKPVPPAKPTITPAQYRVVMKAKRGGGVKMADAFGTQRVQKAHQNEEFDRKPVIERCVKAGWVFYGEGFGTYVTTAKGLEEAQRYVLWLDAKDSYQRDLKAWRAQQRAAFKTQKGEAAHA